MHWAEEIAKKIIARNPNKEEYVCAAGISPSGSIHIGNFRDVATSYFVYKALKKLGKNARLLFSWDEYDRLRKVPVNVAKVDSTVEACIGKPYVDIHNPFNTEEKTYAEYFEKEFEASMKLFGIEMDYRHQADMYRSGKYAEYVLHALKHRGEIFDIIDRHRTQDAQEGEREAYFPVSIYCEHCQKDTTKIVKYDEENYVCEYDCSCGHHGVFDFKKDYNCKLAWKVDWPMRWLYEKVDFEPGGKDHASINGSYDTSKEISKLIFNYDAPIFQGYEFIGIRGTTGKMSGSSGLNLTPETLLKLYEPEVLLWLYSKTDPTKAFDFCFDDGILRQYFEFDKMYDEVHTLDENGNTKAQDYAVDIMYYTEVPGRTIKTVPMGLIVQLGSVVDFNVPMLEIVFEKIGTPYKYNDFKGRLDRAKFWLEQCAPENRNVLRKHRNWDVYETLSDLEKEEIKELHSYLKNNKFTLEELQTELYAVCKRVRNIDVENKELKQVQGAFFKNVYKLLIDKEKGPRLYLFLFAINLDDYLPLLDFSYPKTEEEAFVPVVEEEPVVEEVKEPDPVQPVKEEITIDDFIKVDLRVCEVVKCTEIRKSHNCLKLVLNDGLKERTIVSSIKGEYKPEELIGKKIIVVANLKSTRITGVTSEGMLLAGTNNACGCKVIFVDPSVPVGTMIK